MKKIVLFFVAVIFLVGMATTGFCQIKPGKFSLTPYIGGYQFEGNQDFDTSLIVGLRLGCDFTKHFGGEISTNYGGTNYTEFVPEINMRMNNYRVEGLYHFMPDSRIVPFVAMGIGGQRNDYERTLSEKWRATADYGAGLKLFLTDSVALRADVRHVLASGSIHNNLEYALGLSVYFGGAKPAPVAVKKPEPPPAPAPPKPPAKPGSLYASAASESQIDVSWNAVKGAKAYKVYRNGGYAFTSDTGLAFDQGLNPDTRYCYQVSAIDDKGLESPLSTEKCATTHKLKVVEAKKEAVAAPVMTEKEKKAEAVAKEIREKGKATIDIKFDTNKANVKAIYHEELEKFALVLKNNPDLKITIAGHTDNRGKDDYNLKLSQKRAESVMAYLIKKFGIAEDRMKAKGYGEARPEYDNRVAIGRAKNRRVEAVTEYFINK